MPPISATRRAHALLTNYDLGAMHKREAGPSKTNVAWIAGKALCRRPIDPKPRDPEQSCSTPHIGSTLPVEQRRHLADGTTERMRK